MSPEEFQLSDNALIREYVETTMGPIYSSDQEESVLYETV
jgi:phospholipid/cholesterol/gamma-HCH transport system ATP-binding protein